MKAKPGKLALTFSALALVLAAGIPATVHAGQPGICSPVPFTVHEWGTFTSVAGSDGRLLPGVHQSEEPLPAFTYAHEAMHHNNRIATPFTKGIEWSRPLLNVNVRMETPVIYFYTKQPFHAQVQVGFKGGTISQWYPQRSGGNRSRPSSETVKDGRSKAPTLSISASPTRARLHGT